MYFSFLFQLSNIGMYQYFLNTIFIYDETRRRDFFLLNFYLLIYCADSLARLRSTPDASTMLIQYKNSNGMATRNWLVQSGEGVMMAATTKIITNANLKYFLRKLPVMIPIFASTKQSMGISNASPQPSIRLVRLST